MYHFDAEYLKKLLGPGVYLFFRDSECVYVGSTAYGMGRPCGPGHAMRKHEGLSLIFQPMGTGGAAFDLEAKMILDLNPEYNISGKEERRRYQQRYRAAHDEEKLIREMLRHNFGPHPDGRY